MFEAKRKVMAKGLLIASITRVAQYPISESESSSIFNSDEKIKMNIQPVIIFLNWSRSPEKVCWDRDYDPHKTIDR